MIALNAFLAFSMQNQNAKVASLNSAPLERLPSVFKNNVCGNYRNLQSEKLWRRFIMASSITRVCASPAGHLSGYFYSSMKRSRLTLARVNGAITDSLDPYSYSHNFSYWKAIPKQSQKRGERIPISTNFSHKYHWKLALSVCGSTIKSQV